ncbi:fibronectin type III domain-containing protein [Tsukamurella sp. M9C]|uniref:fibronectin type III domain-containing protein n=1 Tax=Tsukamurella sp. M9C TaxID=2877520 RepID=UPI001CCC834C|nr:fibronectin type III domain-containing protein [Tsukamurella sp. M9C]MCA0155348.1 fibronectin type III domain-containing protein [Tsukamurella sp. M9C]
MSTRTNRSDRPRGTRYLGAAVAWGAVVCGVLAVPAPATAVPVGGDQVLCAVGQPCIDNLYQTGTTIVVEWKGDQEWDAYNVRWSRPGRAETQHAVAGGRRGSFRITTVNPGVTYTVKVQGCETHVLSSSTCSPWEEASITARPNLPYGPDTCKQGFVWREARTSDRVCVTPSTRTATAEENRLAASRRQPGGGAYGPNTCRQGFVWREAYAGDVVCVTPASRSRAHADNAAASSRRVLG